MKRGFTLIELLVATAIFTIVIVSFVTIFITIAGVQAGQVSKTAVSEESQLLLQRIQYYVELSSAVSSTANLSTSTLTLRMASSSIDPTVIGYCSSSTTTVCIQQGTSTVQQTLTSGQVQVQNLLFTPQSNPPGHDSVSVSYIVVNNTQNLEQEFSQVLQTSVARVSAATFSSGLFSTSPGQYGIGAQAGEWQYINGGTMYFDGYGDVGVGVPSSFVNNTPGNPYGNQSIGYGAAMLDIQGGIQLTPTYGTSTLPACSGNNYSLQGTIWFAAGTHQSTKDYLYLCGQNASGSLQWMQIQTLP